MLQNEKRLNFLLKNKLTKNLIKSLALERAEKNEPFYLLAKTKEKSHLSTISV